MRRSHIASTGMAPTTSPRASASFGTRAPATKNIRFSSCSAWLHGLTDAPGAVVIIWDGAPWHRAKCVQAAAVKLGFTLIALPAYSPDLKPDRSSLEVDERRGDTQPLPRIRCATSSMPAKPSSTASIATQPNLSIVCGPNSNSTKTTKNSWFQIELTLIIKDLNAYIGVASFIRALFCELDPT